MGGDKFQGQLEAVFTLDWLHTVLLVMCLTAVASALRVCVCVFALGQVEAILRVL